MLDEGFSKAAASCVEMRLAISSGRNVSILSTVEVSCDLEIARPSKATIAAMAGNTAKVRK